MSSIFACDLGLNRKTLSCNFFCCFVFVFEKFSSTSTGGKCALRWFYCLEKQKFSLERTQPGKKLRFCIRYLWKMKEKPANLNRGVCFSMKGKATCRNWAQLDEEKQFSLKSHLWASCMQPFNCCRHPYSIPLFKLYTQIKIAGALSVWFLWSCFATEQIQSCQFSRTCKQSTLFTTRCFMEQRNTKWLNNFVLHTIRCLR